MLPAPAPPARRSGAVAPQMGYAALMPLHPQAQAVLEARARAGLPPVYTMTGAEARAQAAAQPVTPVPAGLDVSIEDRTIPGPGGPIPVRIYAPGANPENIALPVLVWYHGGGWVTGTLDSNDAVCALLAHEAGAVVMSVDYRLAPEHRFPAAAEDAYAAALWAAEHADEIGADGNLVAVGGASAGANLAAAVTLMAREREAPKLVHQLLAYPVTDRDFERESYALRGEGNGLETAAMRWYWEQYLGPDGDFSNPFAAPLRAESLAGLPRAHVITAEYDPLCDEGEEYARCMESEGVFTVLTRYAGQIHGFFGMIVALDDATKAVREAANELRISVAVHRG